MIGLEERCLLHLHKHHTKVSSHQAPWELCQSGIALSLQITQPTASKVLKKLENQGLVEKKPMRIAGERRRRFAYTLTPQGLRHVGNIIEDLLAVPVDVKRVDESGKEVVERIKIEDCLKLLAHAGYRPHISDIVEMLAKKDKVDLEYWERAGRKKIGEIVVRHLVNCPPRAKFVDREEEIARVLEGIRAGKCVIIYGIPGIGKTTLMREVVEILSSEQSHARGVESKAGTATFQREKPYSVFWYQFSGAKTTLQDFCESLRDFTIALLKKVGSKGVRDWSTADNWSTEAIEDILGVLRRIADEYEIGICIALDDIHNCTENLVQALRIIVTHCGGNIGVVATSRKRIGAFSLKDLASVIVEVHLGELKPEHCAQMLGVDDEGAYIVHRMSGGIPLLVVIGGRIAPESLEFHRERYIEGIMNMLSSDEKNLLMYMSAHFGGVDREEVERLGKNYVDVLRRLVEKNVVLIDDEGNYTLHSALRSMIVENYDLTTYYRKIAEYYMQSNDIEDIVLGIRYLQLAGDHDAVMKSICNNLEWFVSLEVDMSDVIGDMPEAYDSKVLSILRAVSLIALGDIDKAISELRAGIKNPKYGCEGRKEIIDDAINDLLAKCRKYADALQRYKESLKRIRDKRRVVRTIIKIASLYRRLGQWDRALKHARKALKEAKDDEVIAAHNTIALILMDMGEIERAQEHLMLALRHAEKMRNAPLMAKIMHNIGEIKHRAGAHEEAIPYLSQALDIFKNEGMVMEYVSALRAICEECMELGLKSDAIDYCVNGERFIMSIRGYEKYKHMFLEMFADLLANASQFGDAIDKLKKSYELTKNPEDKCRIALKIADCYLELQNYAEGEAWARTAQQLCTALPYPANYKGRIASMLRIGEAYLGMGLYDKSLVTLKTALEIARAHRDVYAVRAVERALKDVKQKR